MYAVKMAKNGFEQTFGTYACPFEAADIATDHAERGYWTEVWVERVG
jgi:hypothetical protein